MLSMQLLPALDTQTIYFTITTRTAAVATATTTATATILTIIAASSRICAYKLNLQVFT